MALLNGALGHGTRLEFSERLRPLAVERDLDNRGQPVAERFGREEGDAALDDTGVDERLDTAKAGCRGGGDPLGKGLIGQRGVALEMVEDLEVGSVKQHQSIKYFVKPWILH